MDSIELLIGIAPFGFSRTDINIALCNERGRIRFISVSEKSIEVDTLSIESPFQLPNCFFRIHFDTGYLHESRCPVRLYFPVFYCFGSR